MWWFPESESDSLSLFLVKWNSVWLERLHDTIKMFGLCSSAQRNQLKVWALGNELQLCPSHTAGNRKRPCCRVVSVAGCRTISPLGAMHESASVHMTVATPTPTPSYRTSASHQHWAAVTGSHAPWIWMAGAAAWYVETCSASSDWTSSRDELQIPKFWCWRMTPWHLLYVGSFCVF